MSAWQFQIAGQVTQVAAHCKQLRQIAPALQAAVVYFSHKEIWFHIQEFCRANAFSARSG